MVKYINTIKRYLFFALSILSYCTAAEAQYLISGDQKTAFENDSVILYLDTIRGDVQWQVSEDRILWENINGETNDSLFLYVDNSAYYRAMITEGTCTPVFSDTVLIAQVYDNRDNQYYDAVKIGEQWWMAENLRYYTPSGSWFYDDDSVTYSASGRLYNWYIAESACPTGWHLPSDDEWKVLELELGMSKESVDSIEWRGTEEGDKLKPSGSSGFDALFAGYRDDLGIYRQYSVVAAFWTSSEENTDLAWYRGLTENPGIFRYQYDKDMAFSIRCVKSQSPAIRTNPPKSVATKSAILSASLIHKGGSDITEKGFCWSISPSPTISDNTIKDTTNTTEQADFSSLIDGLQINTTYYVRAYAINDYGTGYGGEISFTTKTFSSPIVITTPVTSIGMTSARSGGEIVDGGEREVTDKGICWSTSADPTIQDEHTSDGSGTDAFSSQMTGLAPNTFYYIRAYAINNVGVSYGENRTFITLPVNPVDSITDSRDGTVYKTINIGGQWWMAENLNYQIAGSWCYESIKDNCDEYGRLYFWSAAKNACPSGWHLPGDNEWKELEMNLGMSPEDADAIDQRGTDEGTQLKTGGSSGFDVLFGGIIDEAGTFTLLGTGGAFWTSSSYDASQAWYRGFSISESRIHRYFYDTEMGFSIRCVRDELPVVITAVVDSIGKTYARCGGEVLKDGGFEVTERGVCWGTEPSPTIDGNHSSDGSGTGKFISILTGLTKNRTYHVRAYATNSVGTAYGEERTFKTVTLPKVTTSTISSISTTSAVGGGDVTDDGGVDLLSRGICWSKDTEPTINNFRTNQSGNTGIFISNMADLAPNTDYYVKAYATNNVGTVYGEQVTFDTPPLNPLNSMTDSRDGHIYSTINIGDLWWFAENLNYQTAGSWCYENSSSNCTDYGRLYTWSAAVSACPPGWHLASDMEWKNLEMSLGMSQAEADAIDQRGTDQGTQLKDNGSSGFDVLFGGFRNEDGTFSSSGTGGAFWTSSEYNAQAWYRGFSEAEPRVHRYYYNKNMGFSARCVRNELPVVLTADIISYTDSSVYGGGNVTYDGGLTVTARGICISTLHNPTTVSDTTNDGTGMGAFTSYKKGLNPATTYYVRAYAINSKGTSYGEEKSFTTGIGIPKVTTSTVSLITDSSARCGGIVTSSGGAAVIARGVCWSLSQNPDISDSKTTNGTGTGLFVSQMTGLQPNTTYYVRAYATNSAGTGYGAQRSFTTDVGLPKVTTATVTNITETTATGGGSVTSTGGAAVIEKGICWSLSANPTTSDHTTDDGSGTGSFVSQMTGLDPNKTYYVRAYATNSEGTGYGSQVSFVTSTALPQVTTGTISDTTTTTATFLGNNAISDGGSPITHKGVCWSESSNPTITDNATDNGTGTGPFNSLITGLTRNTLYYVRAYATNDKGTGYGNNVSFRTKAGLPAVTTAAVTSVTHNTAQSGGTITDDGGASITRKGVCWNTTGSPDITDSHTDDGTGSGAFTSSITGLDANTTYYVRAYAQNSAGITYGNPVSFTTPHETGLLTDTRDSQEYPTVKIGDDWWMAENLNYRETGSVYYDNDSAQYAEIYGRLYTWTSMMKGAASSSTDPSGVQGVCPSGWHVPSNLEWSSLISDLGGITEAGAALKETGTANWVHPNNYATNESGFTARPAGMVDVGMNSSGEGTDAYFWTTTETDPANAYIISLVKNSAGVTNPSQSKADHYSVRCIKN